MRDIAEKLLWLSSSYAETLSDYERINSFVKAGVEAAEEITHLRAENEKLRRDVKTAIMGDSAELADVKRDNENLRKILQALINDIEDYEHINNITPKFSKLCCVESIRNAREILKK